MNQKTPIAFIQPPSPFDHDGNFIAQKAIELAAAQRALGDLDAAEALDLLVDFFSTSQNYVLNGVALLDTDYPPDVSAPILPIGIA